MKMDKRGLAVFLIYTGALLAVFILFTRLCFIADSRLVQIQDPAAWRLARRALSAYFEMLLPRKARVDYVALDNAPRAAVPRRIFFPNLRIIRMDQPTNMAAYRTPPLKPLVGHPLMIPTPFVIYAPAPYDVEEGGTHAYHNIQQFRHARDLSAKPPNEIRIFITGGSTAWGSMAPDLNSTISGFMNDILNNGSDTRFVFTVINAAVGGYTTTHERIWIQNRVSQYEPDLIVSYSGYNDVYTTFVEKSDIFNRLNDDADYYFAALREFEFYNRGEEPVKHMRIFGKLFYDRDKFPAKTMANIRMIASYLHVEGVPYVFVLQPVNGRAPANAPLMPEFERLARALDQTPGDAPFSFVDHSNLLKDREQLFLDECHVGDIANRLIAEAVVRDIQPLLVKVLEKRRAR